MAFLNSIFYPKVGEDGFRIKELKMIDGERTQPGQVRGKGTQRSDLACKCTCWDGVEKPRNKGNIEMFDVEMQRTYNPGFMDRIQKYGENLRKAEKGKVGARKVGVRVLALYNYVADKDVPSVISRRVVKDLETGAEERTVEGEPEIYLINLADRVAEMERGKRIMVENQELGEEGELWLALLGIRQWQENRKLEVKQTYFIAPGFGQGSQEFQSALLLLNARNKNQKVLDSVIDEIEREKGMFAGALEIASEKVKIIEGVKGAMKSFMDNDKFAGRVALSNAKKCIGEYNKIRGEKSSLKGLWSEVLEEWLSALQEMDIEETEVSGLRVKFAVNSQVYNDFMTQVLGQTREQTGLEQTIEDIKRAMWVFMDRGFRKDNELNAKKCIEEYNKIRGEKPSLGDLWSEVLGEWLHNLRERGIKETRVEGQRTKFAVGGKVYNGFMARVQEQSEEDSEDSEDFSRD
jgi:hypothetical protein